MCANKTVVGLKKLLENTPESYYWIGFLLADGYFDHNGRGGVQLALSRKDKNHIVKFAKLIDVGYKNTLNGGYKQVRVTIGDKETIKKLSNKFNIKHRKTYNPPSKLNIRDNDLFLSLFIGYIDGDGYMGNNLIEVCCHESWGKVLQNWFDRAWQISGVEITNYVNKKPTMFKKGKYIRIKSQNNKFCNFLKDKTIELKLPVLKRKWDRIRPYQHYKYNTIDLVEKVRKIIKKEKNQTEIARMLKIDRRYLCDVIHKYKLL